jgi:murein DD-endopeptidase MepM/ murein hydrolase activator NlpD
VFEGYTSHFGMRRAADGILRPHNGLDIAAPLGSPVLSWWHGTVIETIHDQSCGIGVVIASGDYYQIWCHLRRQRMRPDQWVNAGQVIGQLGLTGRTSGAHLHWGIRHSGRWLDPAQILRAMIRSRRAIVSKGP